MEEKQNFQTFQDSDTLYPKKEKEVAEIIKKFHQTNTPIEITGSGSKKKLANFCSAPKL